MLRLTCTSTYMYSILYTCTWILQIRQYSRKTAPFKDNDNLTVSSLRRFLSWYKKVIFTRKYENINIVIPTSRGDSRMISEEIQFYQFTVLTLRIQKDRPMRTVQTQRRCHRMWHLVRVYNVCYLSSNFKHIRR